MDECTLSKYITNKIKGLINDYKFEPALQLIDEYIGPETVASSASAQGEQKQTEEKKIQAPSAKASTFLQTYVKTSRTKHGKLEKCQAKDPTVTSVLEFDLKELRKKAREEQLVAAHRPLKPQFRYNPFAKEVKSVAERIAHMEGYKNPWFVLWLLLEPYECDAKHPDMLLCKKVVAKFRELDEDKEKTEADYITAQEFFNAEFSSVPLVKNSDIATRLTAFYSVYGSGYLADAIAKQLQPPSAPWWVGASYEQALKKIPDLIAQERFTELMPAANLLSRAQCQQLLELAKTHYVGEKHQSYHVLLQALFKYFDESQKIATHVWLCELLTHPDKASAAVRKGACELLRQFYNDPAIEQQKSAMTLQQSIGAGDEKKKMIPSCEKQPLLACVA